jgi:hypothetical protein
MVTKHLAQGRRAARDPNDTVALRPQARSVRPFRLYAQGGRRLSQDLAPRSLLRGHGALQIQQPGIRGSI